MTSRKSPPSVLSRHNRQLSEFKKNSFYDPIHFKLAQCIDEILIYYILELKNINSQVTLCLVTSQNGRCAMDFFTFFFLINKYFFKHKNPIVWNKSNTVEMVKSKAWCHGRIGGGGCLMTQHVICREEKNQQRQRLFGNDWDNTLSALCFLSISFPTGRLFQV